jgi:membrane-bound serine protease (ClpP class)
MPKRLLGVGRYGARLALVAGVVVALAASIERSSAQLVPSDAGVEEKAAPGGGPVRYHPEPSKHADAAKRELKVATAEGAKVLRIPIEGTIDLGLAAFIERALAAHADAALVILDINTLGGRVDAAIKVRDALLNHKVRTVAFIHPRAISAGALIALACDVIAMAPGATLGAVTPMASDGAEQSEGVEEKMTSYMRAEMRSTAEANGRRGDVAEAMVDRAVVIKGVVEGGKLLTLDTDRALALNMADLQVASVPALLEALSLRHPKLTSTQENWAEKIARFLTDPAVAGLLMSLGMLGLLIELYSPGVGLPGAVGVLCLSLFFGGHMIANLAGLEEVLLLIAGLGLLAVELFLLPGFGVAGIAGIVCIGASFVLTLLTMPLSVAWDLGMVSDAIERVSISLLVTLALGLVAMRFLPKTRAMRQLVLSHATTADAGFVSAPTETALVGVVGTAVTDLHPTGKAELAGTRHDVLTEGDYIERGTKVRVVEATAGRIVVRRDAEP